MTTGNEIPEEWIKITIRFLPSAPEHLPEMLIAELSHLGYNGFLEKNKELTAWIDQALFSYADLEKLQKKYLPATYGVLSHGHERNENWNERWEKNYQPVWIDHSCQIRASFHAPAPDIPFDLVINPGMAFGTGHHETTRLMLSMMLATPFEGKEVLDMGCGTGVLSVLASRKGASQITAIDNFPKACSVTRENARLNHCNNIEVIEGDHHSIPQGSYDFILANITRNVILEMLPTFSDLLDHHGKIFVSGFYFEDRRLILQAAVKYGLQFRHHLVEEQWTAMLMSRE